jgi:hypothetical protein
MVGVLKAPLQEDETKVVGGVTRVNHHPSKARLTFIGYVPEPTYWLVQAKLAAGGRAPISGSVLTCLPGCRGGRRQRARRRLGADKAA